MLGFKVRCGGNKAQVAGRWKKKACLGEVGEDLRCVFRRVPFNFLKRIQQN